jgi:DNA-binding CsgD family transcriptional regulator
VKASAKLTILVELPTTRVLASSSQVRDLMGVEVDESMGLDGFGGGDEPSALRPFELLTAGMLETLHGRYRFRRRDGSVIVLWCWIRAIRSPCGADLALVCVEARSNGEDPDNIVAAPFIRSLPNSEPSDVDPTAILTLDEQWYVSDVVPQARLAIRGPSRPISIGERFLDRVHPDDRTRALCAFALATSGARVGAWFRMSPRKEEYIHPVTAVVTLKGNDQDQHFVIELYKSEDGPATTGSARAEELERRLRRIAAEVRAADLLEDATHQSDLLAIAGLPELSERQREIVDRLLHGERVPTIARAMYVSQTTIRNHLSAVFKKLGVHSQAELIAVIRRRAKGKREPD